MNRRSLRYLIPFLVCASLLVVLVSKTRGHKAEERRTVQQRRNYAEAVRVHFHGHDLWKSNEIIQENLKFIGGGRYGGSIQKKGFQEFIFKAESDVIQREVLATLLRIHEAMDTFASPNTMVVSDSEGLLASPEGWLRFSAKWISDPSQISDDVKRLRVDRETYFVPSAVGSTEKQDMRRLTWVRWSPPLEPKVASNQ